MEASVAERYMRASRAGSCMDVLTQTTTTTTTYTTTAAATTTTTYY